MILAFALLFLAIAVVNALFWPRVGAAARLAGATSLSVLIPARNEAENIGPCLTAVLSQSFYVSQVLVYDDHSSDRTGEIAASTGDPRVKLIEPVPLPAGWFGKTFACVQLAKSATTGWLLFLDADTRLQPDACARMLAEAERRKLTFLSCWPGFVMLTWPERLLMPMLNFIVFSIFPGPLSVVQHSKSSLGLAHGACILVQAEAYARVGGHTAVRREIFEDTRLAQIWREKSERGLCLDGSEVVSVRMYDSYTQIWRGFTKNFYLAFRNPLNFWAFLLVHFSVFLLPFLGFSWRAALAVMALRAVLAIRFGQGWWSVLVHPFAEAVVLAIGIGSWRAARSKSGVAWKGRQYPVTRA